MSLLDHIRSGVTGVRAAGAFGLLASAGCFIFGAMGAPVVGALAMPALIGGGIIWGAGTVGMLILGPQRECKHLAFALGLGITGYCMLANFGPTKDAMPYRNEIFGNSHAGLSQKFHHAAREANKHIIWPDMGSKPAHQRQPGPGYP